MRNKYNNNKLIIDGESFDSQKEYKFYQSLKHLESESLIKDLQRQVKFTLIPKQYDESGKLVERELSYYADFVFIKDNQKYVLDVKGFQTKEYIIKRKLMYYFHKVKVIEVI